MHSRLSELALTLALGGCASSVTLPAAHGVRFDAIAFFTGRTHGQGELHKLFSSPVAIAVDSAGHMQAGIFVVDQQVRSGDKPPRPRRWTMRLVAPNRYTGTLTDALGPVDITLAGPRAFIRFTAKGGLKVEQQLAIQPGGRTVLNRLEVRKFGARVATLDETIRKID